MFQFQLSTDFYKELLRQMSDGVYFVDTKRKILYWNEGATRLTGYQPEEVVGRYCQDNILCHIDGTGKKLCSEGCPLSACMGDGIENSADIFLRHKQGRRVPVNVRVQPIRNADGTIIGAVEIFSDNTALHEERRKADAMERLAFLDPVTQLPNRRFLEMSVRTAMVEYQTHGDPFGILIFDLNKFKSINDRFGHVSGDRALQEVAKTLTAALRSADIVGRWGGDEYLAVIHNANEELMIHLAKRCVLLVDNSSFLNNAGALVPLSISVGGALVRPGEEIPELIERADALMYQEKDRS
jgi:diguanylate cyclase (GGDEF)-like protein/PAS domain S-box-containing protein